LVLEDGQVPLAMWCEALDAAAERSIPEFEARLAKMNKDLAEGHREGFTASLLLYDKPSFTTLDGFYQVVFELASRL